MISCWCTLDRNCATSRTRASTNIWSFTKWEKNSKNLIKMMEKDIREKSSTLRGWLNNYMRSTMLPDLWLTRPLSKFRKFLMLSLPTSKTTSSLKYSRLNCFGEKSMLSTSLDLTTRSRKPIFSNWLQT